MAVSTKTNRAKVNLDEIRSAAERVAGSLGLDVVDLEFTGTAKDRVLCVYLEKNHAGRAALAAQAAEERQRLAADPAAEPNPDLVLPGRFTSGEINPEQLSWLTHEDCAAFSRDFGTLLDVEDLIPEGEYTLEASSPGLERKLSTPAEFARFEGNLVKVQTLEPIANNRNWQGRYSLSGQAASSDGSITLDLTATRQNSKSRKAGVDSITIAFSNIEKAQLVPEF